MPQLTVGELCAGYGGLGLAVEGVFNARLAWFSEFEAAPSKILAHHWPDVPNYGDMTKIDWANIEPVDIISGGTPCQDLSAAGKRRGMTEGTRSNLWATMREAIATIQPRYVVWENVRGAYSATATSELEFCPGCMGNPHDGKSALRALGRVLGDLSDLGYDCQWRGLRASDVGAPHARFRVFILATHRNGGRSGWGSPLPGNGESTEPDAQAHRADGGPGQHGPAANTHIQGLEISGNPGILPATRGENSSTALGNHKSVKDTDDPIGGERRIPAPGQTETGRARADAGGRSGTPVGDPQNSSGDNKPAQAGSRTPARPARGSNLTPTHTSGPTIGEHPGRPSAEETRPADSDRPGDPGGEQPHGKRRETPANTHSIGSDEGRAEQQGIQGRPDPLRPGHDTPANTNSRKCDRRECGPLGDQEPRTAIAGGGDGAETNWGPYEPAIRRWEQTLGRRAPSPTEPTGRNGGHRLSARFAEWMMGVPDGWITNTPGITRNEALKAAGNGVVPQQAAAALTHMLQ